MYKRYGLLGSIRLVISLIYTKTVCSRARLVRLPFDIRNKQYISIGKGFTSGFGCRIEAHPIKELTQKCVIFGKNVEINDYVHIAAGYRVEIGNNVLIASKVFITDLNHGIYSGKNVDTPTSLPKDRKIYTDPVYIGDRVWLGENVCVLPGVTIGEGTIIGAGSVVTKDVPPNSIAVGNPCKVIKVFDFQQNSWIKI
ncbi:acetyltransferase (plasmid) [Pedobacter sp. BS3]|uniref:DapH/DapD/GlmU-related protein n=1 Tax=Pedobacter sp. BS3 TaxID=2567937 RepID=UPI0011EEB681|nr:DapH/DapD/GlmU-related protein [Pedobacter sp. BS3]TZF86451.1 acetyltransferase [Pedobacter sp. BS3]